MADETTFAVGDIVRLKSGGPAMTVDDEMRWNGTIPVVWFNGDILERNDFWPDALRGEAATPPTEFQFELWTGRSEADWWTGWSGDANPENWS